ncbi:hypothetical protein HanOQP8_Chr13g0501331 [Helianthus annuus]|nr:hypothetical protein HanOQP8_Chr13g0501331 [Helianthus annuus]
MSVMSPPLLFYQFDYVFDWTVLKYPQVGSGSGSGSSSRGWTVGKLPLNPGPSAERVDKTPVKPEVRDGFSGTVESFARRTGLHGEYSRHRSSEHATPSKEMVSCPNSQLALMTCHRSLGKIHISGHLHLSYNIIVT